MRIIVATISMIIISLFGDYTSTMPKQECTHCEFSKKEAKINFFTDQPNVYVHDKDTTLMIQPILENADNPGYRYIQDIKFIYKDMHYCSDMSKITIVNKNGQFSSTSLKRMSCKIVSYVRFNNEQCDILSKVPTQKIIIENLVTDNIYEYQMKDSLYFIKVYKMQDYKFPVIKSTPKFTPKNGGHIK